MKSPDDRRREGPVVGLFINFCSAGAMEGEHRVQESPLSLRLSSYVEQNKEAR
jgi:hypothetical protein